MKKVNVTLLKSILQIILLAVLIVYIAVAILKPSSKDTTTVCSKVSIEVTDSAQFDYITQGSIKEYLKELGLYPQGERMSGINCKVIEDAIQKQQYVSTVNCYKSGNGKVVITILQKKPIIRIMANNGDDYYLDEKGAVLKSQGHPADLVVATGYIDRKFAKSAILELARIIQGDDFWDSQIEQIDVTSKQEIQLVPRVGNHIVFLGPADNIEKKLSRLKQFYKGVISKVGWDKYSLISLEFNNQIICTKKE